MCGRTKMGLWKMLFGETSEPESLEEKVALDAKITERKKQARDRDIRRKAIDVVLELGEGNDSSKDDVKGVSYPRVCVKGRYKDATIHITYSYLSSINESSSPDGDGGTRTTYSLGEHWKVDIYFNRNACYSENGGKVIYDYERGDSYCFADPERRTVLSKHCNKYQPFNFPYGFFHGELGDITTYLPGEWETHLDELYERASQARKEKRIREAEGKIRQEYQKTLKEQESKLSGIEDKKKKFGL